VSLVGRWISSSLIALIPGSATATPLLAVNTDSAHRQAVTVLLREASGQHLGSGVLVGAATGGRWVVSNRHVVGDQRTVCVVTADRTARAALVMPQPQSQQRSRLDMALIWLPSIEKEMTVVAALREQAPKADTLPLIVSTGFPTPLSSPIDGPPYSERPGLLVPLLQAPLEDGLDLTYTASIDKGMSGGGVFLGHELIGINSAHREPLWPGRWRDASRRAVDEQLNQKLDLVSIGISVKQINQAIKSAVPPKDADMNSLMEIHCNAKINTIKPAATVLNISSIG